MEGKNCATFAFIKFFFKIYWCWVSCFYFCKKICFITGNAPLILKIFNNQVDIFFLYVSGFFFSFAFLVMVLLLIFLNYICHLLNFYCYIIYFIVTSIIYYNFISNIDKGIKASEKRLILLEYLRNNINNRGFIFLQETYSSSKDEQKCKDDFKGPLFFSHGKAVFVVWQSTILEQKLFLK